MLYHKKEQNQGIYPFGHKTNFCAAGKLPENCRKNAESVPFFSKK